MLSHSVSLLRVKLGCRVKLSGTNILRCATTISADHKTGFDRAALAAAKPFEEMPSVLMLPIIGTSWMYLPIIGRYKVNEFHLAMEDKHKRLGDIFRERVGNWNFVFSFNADDVKTIFENEGVYPTRGTAECIKVYRESRKQWYSTIGLLVLQGKEWHDFRSKTQKHLMKPKAIQAYMDPMQDVAKDLVRKILKVKDANNEVPDFLEELYRWALESVAVVGLDTRLGCLETDLSPDSDGLRMISSVKTQFESINKLDPLLGNIPFWKLFPTPMWKRFTAAADVFIEIAFKHINRATEELKKAANEGKDLTLLQSMLATEGMDISGAFVMVADMLMAGIDTTSHSLGFFLYHMARNPDKQELLHQEIRRLMPTKEDRITSEIFNDLKYLKACMKESHRMVPVFPGIGRMLDHDIVLSGYRVPAGTTIVAMLQLIGHDARYFSDPNQYLPERWLEKDEKFHTHSFLPFSFGTRSCVGRRLAELETICVVTELIKNFRIEYHHEDIGLVSRIINIPDKPLRLTFTER